MIRDSEEDKAILLRFNITQKIQIKLTRLKVHTNPEEKAKLHHCHHCKYSSKNKGDLRNHLRTHTGEKPFACNLCKYKSARRSALNTHIMTHTGEKHHNCAFCTKSFRTASHQAEHEQVCKFNPRQSDPSWVQNQKTFKCQQCPFSSLRKTHLNSHLRIHTGEKPFPCNLCDKKFNSGAHMRDHIFTHTREKPHNCQFCTKGFAQGQGHKRHEKTCKANPKQRDPRWVELQKAFKCQLCVYSTAISNDLKRHMLTHTGGNPFACTLCSHQFSSRTTLQSHILTHNREKLLNCQFCTKGFAQVTSQKRHEKTCKLNPQQGDEKWIEEQKKFKCHFCKYRTMTKWRLESHLRSHTGEKPYHCPLCLYECSNNSQLHYHLSHVHVWEKGYKCPEYKATTLSTSKLLNHVKVFHEKLST